MGKSGNYKKVGAELNPQDTYGPVLNTQKYHDNFLTKWCPVFVYVSKPKLTILYPKRYLAFFFNLQKCHNHKFQIQNAFTLPSLQNYNPCGHCSLCLKGSYQGYCNFDISEMIRELSEILIKCTGFIEAIPLGRMPINVVFFPSH